MAKVFLYGMKGGGGGGTLQEKTVALDMSAGDQEISPDTGYDGLSKAKVTRPATLIPENIKNGVSIGGVTGTYEGSAIPNELDDLVDGTITTFTMPQGKSRVHRYLFYNDTALTSANLQGATVIEEYAFYGCTNAIITLPSTLASIGSYAFYNANKSTNLMELNCPNGRCSIGSYAFYGSSIKSIKGYFSTIAENQTTAATKLEEIDIDCTQIANNAFMLNGCQSLSKIHIVLNGPLGYYGLATAYWVTDFRISGNITSLGSYALYGLGGLRSNPKSSPIIIDFSGSTFTAVETSAFASQASNSALNYTTIILPSTVTSLGTQSFYYIKNSDIFFLSSTPPTAQSKTFQSMSNTTLWIPYNSVNAYRTAANWSASEVSSKIKGYAPANTFTTGQTLPTINEEGYGLTWYSDKACTLQVTTADDPTQELYCIVGTTIQGVRLKKITTINCTLSISDGTFTYSQGDMVMVGSSLTITASAPQGYVVWNHQFLFDGTEISSGDSVTVPDHDVEIKAMYWDEVTPPISPVLNDNSWEIIQFACENGFANMFTLGDYKVDDSGVSWVLVDKKAGRYAKENGGYTNAVFMKSGVFSSKTSWGITQYNEGYAASNLYAKLQQGGAYYNTIDQEVRTMVNGNKITLKSTISSQTTTTSSSTVGFFTPCYHEYGGTGSPNYATTAETTCNGTVFGAFEYFETDGNARRQKGQIYWSRTRAYGTRARGCWVIKTDGTIADDTSITVQTQEYATACFAL